ncbi:hypothetical protein BB8028_0006g05300 [Beauveria bassiana]|uniref:Uncharacterized protein n=1 Tax=Beauveria bassiana TaxID=176275 RepID=A0A2S7YJT6_BEABA|nr:hypothetical protein BB8028_0006g05300 [Beauveria bassiana]
MPPFISQLVRRTFDFGIASREFSDQFKNPSDIFSVLLLLGGASDPVGRALAQISGSRVTPVAFSFGNSYFYIYILAMSTGSLGQWSREKWACRRGTRKNFVLTQGNGSQHAIVIIGNDKGLDLEDLAMGLDGPRRVTASLTARITVMVLALLWLFLLITATGIKQHTWYILTIGFLGILGNTHIAGANRRPEMQGIPLIYEGVICETKVMATLLKVEKEYPKCGICMVNMFFPGKLRPIEEDEWAALDQSVGERYMAWREARHKN